MGFIGVFSGATNTPIACFVMGIDIPSFGKNVTIFISNIVSCGINDEDNISIVVDSVALNGILFLPIVKRMKEKNKV
ncbi:hypothetical protein EfmJHP36_22710 [Enterococcus faecium]|nr:hypothetical protein EfmJHP36_22710 [Enterococcus faecium]